MRVLVVDDEPLARRELRRLLADHPAFEVVGEASHVDQAEERISALAPDLLLLDIHMPGGTGFDLLARLDHAPRVIFTTANEAHALRAFEVNALDYLLKPIEPERLAAALERVTAPTRSPEATSAPLAHLDRVFVREDQRCWFVPIAEVHLLASEGNYTRLHWNGTAPMLARSLVRLERRLDPRRFFRANRHEIINLELVERVEVGIGGTLLVALRGGAEVEISRRQARVFRARTSA